MTLIETPSFSIGAALSRGFSVSFRNLGSLGLLALVLTSPTFIYQVALDPMAAGARELRIGELVVGLVQFVLTYLLNATVVYATIQELRGRHASLGDAIGRGLAALPAVIGVLILTSIIVGLGFMLLVIPGLIAMTILWVAIPAAVVERPGVFASLKRSAELTRGARWKIFGLVLILILVNFGIGAAVALVLGVGLVLGESLLIGGLINYVASALIALVGTVVTAVTYYDLRAAKEGVDIDQIAAVFD